MRRTLLLLYAICTCYSLYAEDIKHTEELTIIENKGQITNQYNTVRSDIDFRIAGKGLNVFIGTGRVHYQFAAREVDKVSMHRLDMELQGCNLNAKMITDGEQAYHENYYLAHCPGGITARAYSKVTYKEIYPNIDWVLYTRDGKMEYDFVIRPGGRIADIQMKYSGATELQISEEGRLLAVTPMGVIKEAAPYSYQANGKEVRSAFVLNNDILGFTTGKYNGTLTIDPVLEWSTYYGDAGMDYINNLTCDGAGNSFVVGETSSLNNIATTGSHQATYGGGLQDGFMAAFDSSGVRLWSTYYGGSGEDAINNIILGGGDLYIAGTTTSATGIATVGSHQELAGGYSDMFLARFSASGVRQWATYYGGDSTDGSFTSNAGTTSSIAYDPAGFVYISGRTNSGNNIATIGTYLPTLQGYDGSFIAKFTLQGQQQWGSYYDSVAKILCISFDTSSGAVYVGGSTTNVYLSTLGAYQENLSGFFGLPDGFVTRFNGQGQRTWATYFGGYGNEQITALVCDGIGNIYAGGQTSSASGISTIGSHQPVYGGGFHDMFLAKFTEQCTLNWATYYGGENNEGISSNSIAMDDSGYAYLCGETNSIGGIATVGSYQTNLGGGFDAVLVKFDSAGVREWGTYFGGPGDEGSQSCRHSGGHTIFLSGVTSSTSGIATTGAHQQVYGGGVYDGFLAKFNDCDTLAQPLDIIGDTLVCAGDTVTYYVPAVAGATFYTWSLPNGWTGTSNTNSITVVAGNAGGAISVTAGNSCITSALQDVAVTVHPLPVPVITQNGTMLSTGTYVTYQWMLNGAVINGATSQTYTAAQDGDYTVIVTDANGCSGTSDTILVSLKLHNVNARNGIGLYPNPSTGNFTINGTIQSADRKLTIEVFDKNGKIVYRNDSTIDNNRIDMQVSLKQTIVPGLYTVRLISDQANYTLPFVKM